MWQDAQELIEEASKSDAYNSLKTEEEKRQFMLSYEAELKDAIRASVQAKSVED